jgi:hypothetical protein
MGNFNSQFIYVFAIFGVQVKEVIISYYILMENGKATVDVY